MNVMCINFMAYQTSESDSQSLNVIKSLSVRASKFPKRFWNNIWFYWCLTTYWLTIRFFYTMIRPTKTKKISVVAEIHNLLLWGGKTSTKSLQNVHSQREDSWKLFSTCATLKVKVFLSGFSHRILLLTRH